MRLLLDEMIGPRVAQQLRERGLDVVAVVERSDLRALSDEGVLVVAQGDLRAVVTRNVADFARLHQQWLLEGREHQGIVMVTEQAFPQNRNLVGALVTALLDLNAQPARGQVLYLKP